MEECASLLTGTVLSQLETESPNGHISYSVDQDEEKEESHCGACTEVLPFPHVLPHMQPHWISPEGTHSRTGGKSCACKKNQDVTHNRLELVLHISDPRAR
jgi:hypothetical protein